MVAFRVYVRCDGDGGWRKGKCEERRMLCFLVVLFVVVDDDEGGDWGE